MPYIPHTDADTIAMLARIGASDIGVLFDEIPQDLRQEKLHNIPDGMTEMSMLQKAQQLATRDKGGICFMGAGSYEHHIPAAVWDLVSRGEFLTAYTPYQAEASQGTLQLLYEYQTMIAELTGMEVANSSMYDGATALAEAVLMAVRVNRQSKTNQVLVVGTLHPLYRATLETIVRNQHIEMITLSFDKTNGTTAVAALDAYNDADITAIVLVQPNFFGGLEPVDAMCDWAHAHNVVSIACVNPIALGALKPPGLWGERGVDIVCGEGQPLGCPMASGGPYFGFFSTRMEHVRQMPGRLIGCTVDKDGKTGYTLTLQAREQHIRRAKATSNICTNQGLLVTAATIHMSLLGPTGLMQVAKQCHHNTHELITHLIKIPGVSLVFTGPYFHEALLQFDRDAEVILQKLHAAGIVGGYAVSEHYPKLDNTLLVCATEMRTFDDIHKYAAVLADIMEEKSC